MNQIIKEHVRKILIIKLRGIGDVILSTIVLPNLASEFPDAKIDYLTESPSKTAIEKIPYINDVIVFDRYSLINRIKLFFEIRKRRYDLIFDFFSNPTTAQITFISGARYRVGFPYKGRKYAYNMFGPSSRAKLHAAQLHLEVLKKFNCKTDSQDLLFRLDDDSKSFDNKYFNEYTLSDYRVVGISPSGGWSSKKCDPIKFAEIADTIIKEFNCKILLLWGPDDKNEAQEIKRMMEHEAILASPTTLSEMSALIEKCDILIANDSGPMHISVALNTPVLSLHGPTNPILQGPYGEKHEWINLPDLDCIGCNLLVCPREHECFLELPIKKIIEKVDFLIQKNNLKIV